MRKLKILIISDYAFVKGGAERVAISSSIRLAEDGHDVVFFSAVGPVSKDLKESKVKRVICLGQKDILDNPNKFSAAISGIYNRQANLTIRDIIRKWNPHLVHFHGVSKAISWSPINTIYKHSVPIIYNLHDYSLLCPNMGIFDFKTNSNCEYYHNGDSIRCLKSNCDKRGYGQKLWRWIRFRIVRDIYKVDKKISGFVAVSNFIKVVVKENLLFDNALEVIYNPVEDFGRIPETGNRGKTDDARFLYIGRLSEEKGIRLLFEAVKNTTSKLVIIGDGELAGFCREMASKIGEDRISILGYQDRKTIREEILQSRALVLPSICMEPAPLVIAEAASLEVPTIAAGHGGIAEFIDDGVSGLYFRPCDPESLTRAINRLEDDPVMAVELGKNAADNIKKMGMDNRTYLKKLLGLYYNILK